MMRRLAGVRLGVVLLFMIGLLSPFAATSAGAQDLTCDDFNSQSAAQAVLEADPSLEDALDPDGDGIACNEDEPSGAEPTEEASDDPTEEPSDDPTEEPSDDPTEEPSDDPSGDGEEYVADIQAEVDALQGQVERFLEIDALGADATLDEVDEINALAAGWVDYPDVAEGLVAPEGFEDVEEAYLEMAVTLGEAGELWEEYWAIPAANDAEEEVALDEFNAAFTDVQEQLAELDDLLAEAGGTSDPTDDPTEEPSDDPTEEPTDDPTEEPTDDPSGDGDAYVADVQGELDDLTEQFDRYDELFADAGSGDLSEAELQDAAAEINDLAAGWVEYPDVAAEVTAPEGYEDIEEAYLDLADTVGETGEAWETYWAIPAANDEEEEVALADFNSALGDARDGIDEVQELVDDAGGSTGPTDDPTEEPSDDPTEEPTDDPTEEPSDDPTEEPSDDPTEEPSGDTADYLETVSETAADWQASLDRFSEIIGLGADATEADTEELAGILTTWSEAPDVAAELDVPNGLEAVQSAYEDFADELAAASTAIGEYLSADPESAEAEEAFTDFITAVTTAQAQYTDLEDLLDDAGA